MTVAVQDIETALGRTLSQQETGQAHQWITDARMLVEVRLGDLSLLNQAALDYVTREAVVARFRNPDGYQSESVDDYTYRHASETRRVTILDEWWALLAPVGNRAAYSVRPGFVTDYGTLG